MEINATTTECIPKLLDKIHDRFFDVDEIKYFQGKQELIIPLHKSADGPCFCTMRICGVVDYGIRDTEKIGLYDINLLEIDIHKGSIKIIGGLPIEIVISINQKWTIALESQMF